MPEYIAPGAVRRLPGESYASFSARQKASQKEAVRAVKRYRKAYPKTTEIWRREADRIDGFDRDDIGESPDR